MIHCKNHDATCEGVYTCPCSLYENEEQNDEVTKCCLYCENAHFAFTDDGCDICVCFEQEGEIGMGLVVDNESVCEKYIQRQQEENELNEYKDDEEDPVQTVLNNLEVIGIKPEEVLIWKFDINEVDLQSADGYVNYLGEKFPNNTVIGMFEHTTLDAYEKEASIKYIEQILEVLKNDNSERSEEQEHY